MTSTLTTPVKVARATKKPPKPSAPADQGRPQATASSQSLQWVTARIEPHLIREIEGYAKKSGMTRSAAIRECLATGIETITERGGISGGRAEELMEAFGGVRAAADILGPPTFGMLRLLAHWAVQVGGLKVSEDELLAEVRAVGADEWEQAVTEAERDLHGTSDKTGEKERR